MEGSVLNKCPELTLVVDNIKQLFLHNQSMNGVVLITGVLGIAILVNEK